MKLFIIVSVVRTNAISRYSTKHPIHDRNFQIVDYIDVSVETVEAAILKYGSVMTCMKWGARPEDVCFMSAYKAG